jgi:hypothetical protein
MRLLTRSTERELLLIAQDLSHISGGSGLYIIALFLLPEDVANLEMADKLISNIRHRLDRYEPWTEYLFNSVVLEP